LMIYIRGKYEDNRWGSNVTVRTRRLLVDFSEYGYTFKISVCKSLDLYRFKWINTN
jgi:hypothetical protein